MFSFARLLAVSLALLGASEAASIPSLNRPAPRTGSYIITLKQEAVARRSLSAVHRSLLRSFAPSEHSEIKYEWPTLNAFAGSFSDAAIRALRDSGDVDTIEPDTVGGLSEIVTQSDAPWGLQRISQVNPLYRRNDSALDHTYTYDNSGGKGVDVYVIDSGINIAHSDFEGRARWGATFGGFADEDSQGHGTHVAGTVAGKRFGVAKNAEVIAVRVVNDAGSAVVSDAIAAVNWIIEEVTTRTHRPSVINISLWFFASDALDAAVAAAIDAGIHVVASAGNFRVEAELYSPARMPQIITVGSTTINDTMSWYNNHGPTIDLLAPGENIISASHTEPDGGYTSMTGTSMAAPHVAGLVAYMVALEGDKPPADVLFRIKDLSPDNIIVEFTGLRKDFTNELIDNGASLKL
ncbi:subtilisin-like protein [Auricularia subglabra TFB-10046 SS5]|nr:subtilisin-like protein [Auricularia subglabra TFB-10046 SS5]